MEINKKKDALYFLAGLIKKTNSACHRIDVWILNENRNEYIVMPLTINYKRMLNEAVLMLICRIVKI